LYLLPKNSYKSDYYLKIYYLIPTILYINYKLIYKMADLELMKMMYAIIRI